jgi:hypothetical protein
MAKSTKRTTTTKKRTPARGKTSTRGESAAVTRKGSPTKTDSAKPKVAAHATSRTAKKPAKTEPAKQKIKAHATSRAAKKPTSKRRQPSGQGLGDIAPDIVIVEVIEEQVPEVVIVTDVETVLVDSDDLIAELIQEDDDDETPEPGTKRQ